ncbi:MAG: hypothetical protein B1H07_01000 [Campylobacteraceae bacterium 4484_166]|nr:MAG: hypothetical protein B1H07_01000 [Campylobacteraceae bacterium 4484_166]
MKNENRTIDIKIDNIIYSHDAKFDVDGIFENELRQLLPKDRPTTAKDLLSAYMHQTLVVISYKKKIDEILAKLEHI